MSTDATATLNELIEITRDGLRFYDSVRPEVKDPVLFDLFKRKSETRAQLIQDLSALVSVQGEVPASGGTTLGAVRQTYADLLAKLSSNSDTTYVNQLEEAEDRLLHAFEDARKATQIPLIAAALDRYLPQVRQMHDEMKNLKLARNAT